MDSSRKNSHHRKRLALGCRKKNHTTEGSSKCGQWSIFRVKAISEINKTAPMITRCSLVDMPLPNVYRTPHSKTCTKCREQHVFNQSVYISHKQDFIAGAKSAKSLGCIKKRNLSGRPLNASSNTIVGGCLFGTGNCHNDKNDDNNRDHFDIWLFLRFLKEFIALLW